MFVLFYVGLCLSLLIVVFYVLAMSFVLVVSMCCVCWFAVCLWLYLPADCLLGCVCVSVRVSFVCCFVFVLLLLILVMFCVVV